jgi:hypothetical protein
MASVVECVYTARTAELSTAGSRSQVTFMSTPPFQPPPPPSPHPGFGHPVPATPGYGAPAPPPGRPAGVIIIAILDILGGLSGLGYAALMGIAGVASGEVQGGLAIFLAVFGLLMAGMGVLHVAAAIGLLTLKPWGRTVQMVLSVIGLLGIPIGTLINGIILYYLTRPGIKLLFSGRPAESFTIEERQLMARGSGQGAMIAIVVVVMLVGGIMVTGIIAAIAIPGLLRARMSGNEVSAIGSLRAMNSAQATWASASGQGTFATLECLAVPKSCGIDTDTAFLSTDMALLSERSGYRFGLALRMTQPMVVPTQEAPVESGEPSDAEVQRQLQELAPGDQPTRSEEPAAPAPVPSGDPVASGYAYWAVPATWGTTGQRIFCTDESGLIQEYLTEESWTEPGDGEGSCPSGGRPLQ